MVDMFTKTSKKIIEELSKIYGFKTIDINRHGDFVSGLLLFKNNKQDEFKKNVEIEYQREIHILHSEKNLAIVEIVLW